jgi:hypothetical protein
MGYIIAFLTVIFAVIVVLNNIESSKQKPLISKPFK